MLLGSSGVKRVMWVSGHDGEGGRKGGKEGRRKTFFSLSLPLSYMLLLTPPSLPPSPVLRGWIL